jgi:Ca-activated chloride channel family protein
MPFDPDDPRLTAFALGELDPADRDEIEAILRDDPEGRAFVLGIEETARLLAEEFRHESTAGPGLDMGLREAVEEQLAAPTTLPFNPTPVPPQGTHFGLLHLAAGFVIVGVTLGLFFAAHHALNRAEAPIEVAQADFDRLEVRAAPKAARPASAPSSAPLDALPGPVAPPPSGPVMRAPVATAPVSEDLLSEAAPAPSAVPAVTVPPPSPAPAPARSERASYARAGELGRKSTLAAPDPSKPLLRSSTPPAGGEPAASGNAQRGLAARGMGGIGGGGMGSAESRSRTAGASLATGPSAPPPPPTETALRVDGERGKAGATTFGLAFKDAKQVSPEESRPADPAKPQSPPSTQPADKPDSAGRPQQPALALLKESQDASLAKNLPQGRGQQVQGQNQGSQGQGEKGQGGQAASGKPGQAQASKGASQSQDAKAATQFGGQKSGLADQLARGDDKEARNKNEGLAELKVRDVTVKEKEQLDALDREVVRKEAEIRQLAERLDQGRRNEDAKKAKVAREAYARFYDNPFVNVLPGNELSTFAIDVDTASYANVRRFLSQGQLPPVEAVRIEELVNYFTYDDPAPQGDAPFSVNVEVAACPWDAGHRLARIGLKGKSIAADKRPMSNLVFLVDVSGSMSDLNKLPLLKAGLKLLVEQLGENDRVGIVTYSNEVTTLMPSTPCHRKAEIFAKLESLKAEGGTNGGAGIQRAYEMAELNRIKGGTNRVILATDGDFNIGLTKDDLLATSEQRAKGGIFLSVLGFGEGNLQEDFMEQLADKGNGNYSYIDTIDEARKVLVRQMSGTLVVIAKDVKIQVEFNPARVGAYRLIGYENRVMANQDFRNDKKDAGEIGAGHSVTALYEIVPAVPVVNVAMNRNLKYRSNVAGPAVNNNLNLNAVNNNNGVEVSPELLNVALRYKKPDGDVATEIDRGVTDDGRDFGRASADFKFAASVAGFGMLLRESPYKGSLTFPAVLEIASSSLGPDRSGDRKGFLEMVKQADQIQGPPAAIAR